MNSHISKKNTDFWNELCGTKAAINLGIKEINTSSILKFDKWFFNYYPYLIPYINKHFKFSNQLNVLEIGIGYGSLSRYLNKVSNLFILDIAFNPINSLKDLGYLDIKGINASVLEAPLNNETFDVVIAIGSLHHTGDFQRSINEVSRLLKPGGIFIGMVYNLLNFRIFLRHPLIFFNHLLFNRNTSVSGNEALRKEADSNLEGEAAPYTDYLTKGSLRSQLRDFDIIDISLNNIFGIPNSILEEPTRRILLKTFLVKYLGLDIYFTAKKRSHP